MADQKSIVPTLEDIARAEALDVQRREEQKKAYLDGQVKILAAVPERFLTMAKQVRDGVNRFNGAAKLPRALSYTETAAVTTRDPNPAADFLVEVRRDPNVAILALRQMRRLRLPDALIIDGEGRVGVEGKQERFHVRIDGLWKDKQLVWRIMSEGKQVDTPIDELPERLVAVVATGEISRLWVTAPFMGR